nr:MAG TPA: hypothetical protein [Caudoviricetes sp.]
MAARKDGQGAAGAAGKLENRKRRTAVGVRLPAPHEAIES